MLFLFFLMLCVLLAMRYRVHVKGLREIFRKGKKGILFLPNHPALIDPVIMTTTLWSKFHPRPMVEEKQIKENPILRRFQESMGILPLPDMRVAGQTGVAAVKEQMARACQALKNGDNVLMYPSGHIYHSRMETLGGKMGVYHILQENPDTRIVFVRTTGLWGSSFSRSRGYQQSFMKIVREHIWHVLLNLFYFGPRRHVTLEFVECPADFPRKGTKEEMNRWMEKFYNENAPHNTYVPYYWWERGGIRIVAEPENQEAIVNTKNVPDSVRQKVYEKLTEITGKESFEDEQTLGTDLGMDSLAVADLQLWLQDEFGVDVSSPDCLYSVGSVLMAAIGESSSIQPLQPIPPNWFIKNDSTPLSIPENCHTVTETFLALAKQQPNFALLGDQNAGVITNKKAVLAIMVLKSMIEKIPCERLGIIMPACAAAFLVYMATLFAGKTPVLLNWTVGPLNFEHCLKNAECSHILTSRTVIERLEGRGTNFENVKKMFFYLEDMKSNLSIFTKLGALLRSIFSWRSLRKAKISPYAALLFTSGSESRPKTVPLTHANVISDIRYSMDAMGLRKDDCMIGMLPPFHSFGLLLDFLMPAVANLRVAYHANPMEGAMLGRIISAYKVTMIVGTPTFASGIFRSSDKEQLSSVRMLITGAEKCPESVYKLFWDRCPGAYFLEGYGITECSPVVALNRPGHPRPGTMGPVIDCLETKILDEAMNPVAPGATGMLYLHGPSVFNGYLNYDGKTPFVEIDGKSWYRTGDLIRMEDDGTIIFMGRLKRFVKIGGEMISLPLMEEVLLDRYRSDENPIPLAIESLGTDDKPNIVLFTNLDLARETVNAQLREAGLAPIYSIRQIVKIEAIPLLGSGKVDYQTLKKYPLDA